MSNKGLQLSVFVGRKVRLYQQAIFHAGLKPSGLGGQNLPGINDGLKRLPIKRVKAKAYATWMGGNGFFQT